MSLMPVSWRGRSPRRSASTFFFLVLAVLVAAPAARAQDDDAAKILKAMSEYARQPKSHLDLLRYRHRSDHTQFKNSIRQLRQAPPSPAGPASGDPHRRLCGRRIRLDGKTFTPAKRTAMPLRPRRTRLDRSAGRSARDTNIVEATGCRSWCPSSSRLMADVITANTSVAE